MSEKILIINATIVNEGKVFKGNLLLEDGFISEIFEDSNLLSTINYQLTTIVDAEGKMLLPGIIDTHVHFREPGMTHKADLDSESRAAVAGGVTAIFDMPNTIPNAVTVDILEEKYKLASEKALCNFSFFAGATNSNFEELAKININEVCGVKLFLGSSTGNMLVDNKEVLQKIFSHLSLPLAAHCEDENIIKENTESYKLKYGEDIPANAHSLIRSSEACYKSTSEAVKMAAGFNSNLHILHVSTSAEIALFNNTTSLEDKTITSETCVHYLFFDDNDYEKLGTLIKCNPSIKSRADKLALIEALKEDSIDTISTDHAPHSLDEKQQKYLKSPSGIPMIQFSLIAMLELYHKGIISIEKIVEKMCHNPSTLYKIDRRGFIRKGYWADLTIVDLYSPWKLEKNNILSKCGWSPFEGYTFNSKVTHTIVNGRLVFENGSIDDTHKGKRMFFNRNIK